MKAKKLMALALAAVMTFSVTACGKGQDTTQTASQESGTQEAGTEAEEMKGSTEGKLTVAIWDSNQQPGIQEILDDWSAQSGIEAETQVITWNEYWTLLEAGASGGSLPDVFWMHSNQSQRYMENGLLLDLTDKIAASDKIDLNNYYEDIVGLYESEGKQYAIPKDIDTIALWYNKTMFDEAGVEYPNADWTWEDFYEAAKKLTKEDGSQWGYAINTGNNQDSYYNMIYDYGGYVISEDKKTSGYDDPRTIEAMQFVERMLREGLCPDLQTISENGCDVLFQSGKVAMITQGSWMVAGFRDNEYTHDNCDVAVLPMGADGTRVSIYNGLGWAAAANGKNTEAAWSLIEYLGSKEAQLKQAELGVTMSAYKGTSDAWVNSVDCFDLKGHLDMLDATLVIRPYSRNTNVWEDMATETFKSAWTGEMSMEEACKQIAESMNTALAEE
ncbi:MAG: extracellular solute-binding protein [Clostridiales bacterium]|nr:extracellular solute-binding protein [Clostridiales bacterium]